MANRDLAEKLVAMLPAGLTGLFNPWRDHYLDDTALNTPDAKLERIACSLGWRRRLCPSHAGACMLIRNGLTTVRRVHRRTLWMDRCPNRVALIYREKRLSIAVPLGSAGCVSWARAGGGLVQTYHFIADESVARGELVEVLQLYGGGSRQFSILYPQNRHLSARVRAFVDYLRAASGGRNDLQ